MSQDVSVLIVDDEEEGREALARALRRAGWRCVAAGNEEEAAALGGQLFDVAVVDVVLRPGGRDGLRVARALRASPGRPAVVTITAFADLATVKQALNDGASYLLEKPFTAGDLIAVIRRLLAERDDPARFVDRGLRRAGLTDKELEIARLVLKGLPTLEIADLLGNSEKTIRHHLTQVYAKCGVAGRAELFHFVFPT